MHTLSVGSLGEVGRRGMGVRVRMRVIETDDIELSGSGRSSGVDVIFRIDQEPRIRLVRNVPGSNDSDDVTRMAKKNPATLERLALTRMRDDVFEHSRRDRHRGCR